MPNTFNFVRDVVKKKYIMLLDETKEIIKQDGTVAVVCRIMALTNIPKYGVCKYDLGGYVQSEQNLDHNGSCWVSKEAVVYDNAHVCDDALATDFAEIFENAELSDRACASEHTKICGHSRLYDDARAKGDTMATGFAEIFENAELSVYAQASGRAKLHGNSKMLMWAHAYEHSDIYGDTEISGCAHIFGHAIVFGRSTIGGHTRVYGHAIICGSKDAYRKLIYTSEGDKIYGVYIAGDNVDISDDAKVLYGAHVKGGVTMRRRGCISGYADVGGTTIVLGFIGGYSLVDGKSFINEGGHVECTSREDGKFHNVCVNDGVVLFSASSIA